MMINFKAIDVPSGEKFIVHIMAAVAEHERDQISKRTTLALQAAKARGGGTRGAWTTCVVETEPGILAALRAKYVAVDTSAKDGRIRNNPRDYR